MSLREGGLSRGSSVSALSGAPILSDNLIIWDHPIIWDHMIIWLSGAASSGGNSTGGGEPLVNVDELTDEQILSLVNETAIAVDRLQLETMMFERYFDKLGGVGDGGGSTAGA